eukprot:29393-Prymnesium_polylepis.1
MNRRRTLARCGKRAGRATWLCTPLRRVNPRPPAPVGTDLRRGPHTTSVRNLTGSGGQRKRRRAGPLGRRGALGRHVAPASQRVRETTRARSAAVTCTSPPQRSPLGCWAQNCVTCAHATYRGGEIGPW